MFIFTDFHDMVGAGMSSATRPVPRRSCPEQSNERAISCVEVQLKTFIANMRRGFASYSVAAASTMLEGICSRPKIQLSCPSRTPEIMSNVRGKIAKCWQESLKSLQAWGSSPDLKAPT